MTLFRILDSTAWNVSTVANNELESAVKYFFPNLDCVSECKVSNVVLEKDRKVTCNDCVTEVLQSVEEKRNILHKVNSRKANWIGHILHKNCF